MDLDFQHRIAWTHEQELIWGVNYRYLSNRNAGKIIFRVEPASSDDQLFSAFVQDQIPLGDAVRLTIGTKLEHNDFSGFEVQPSVRVAWEPAVGHSVWGALSRAVRVPTRLERDIAADVTNPAGNPIGRLLGNPDFTSEKLLASELGYRWQALDTLSFDLAIFHNRYKDLASLEIEAPFINPRDGRTVIPVVNRNLTEGEAQGAEVLVTFLPMPRWRLSATYSYLDLSLDPHGQDQNRGRFLEGATPSHQFGLRSFLELPGGFQIDAQWRSLSAIRSLPEIASGAGIGGYSELDLRIAWQAGERLEVSLVGQNLLHDRHTEFGTPVARGQIERGVYGKIVWRR